MQENSHDDNNTSELTLSEEGSEEVQSQLILSESQQVVTSFVEDIENTESDNANPLQETHKADIFVPQINQYRFKSSVVRQLSNHEKVSSDRLLRIRQSSTNQTSNSNNVRDLSDRQIFGLFDNVAVESIDTVPQLYQVGQIVRMRRYIGNRKVEYIKPVKKDTDDNRNVQLLLKMYNTKENISIDPLL